jgi:hypothetical protein
MRKLLTWVVIIVAAVAITWLVIRPVLEAITS